ncbi:unnamed protein product [Schistosoma mattheei]|uniref:Uncharacterized protein n=1 Tax=Schistosoma mattheei TaxID=31246 RepID=A0A183PS37_9TREM|nr:unnamed protein product [Schistosoma mattheei]
METRRKRLKENSEMDGKISKAVSGMSDVNDDKCDVSINSISSSQLSTSRLKLDEALLKKRNLEKRLEFERQLKMLPNNLELAERKLECLRKKFVKDNSLLEKYQAVMNKHLSKGYITEASKEGFDRDAACWYIPHHPVINPKKPGKLRIAFYCAAVCQGCSHNDQLLRGPNTVNSLIGVLLRFRLDNVALAANIEEMFL